jgi:hypothetical protein
MPGNERIESFIDLTNTEKELSVSINLLEKVDGLIRNMPQLFKDYKGASSLADIKKGTDDITAATKKMADMQQQILDLEKKIAAMREDNSGKKKKQTDEELRTSIQQREENRKRIDDIKAETDAYKALENQYKAAAREAKSLQAQAITDPSKQAGADAAAAKAKSIFDQMKDIDARVGQFYKNVGNYAGSLGSFFDRVGSEIAKLKTEQSGLQDLSKRNPIGFSIGDQERLNQVTASLAQLDQVQQVGFKTTGNYTQQVRQLEKQFISMAASGKQDNQFLTELKNHLGEAKDRVHDLRDELKLASSDTKTFDLLKSGVSGLVAGYQTGLSTVALFAGENENLQKSMVKLIAVQNVANGLQEIGRQLTDHNAAGYKILGLAQKGYNLVVGESVGAMKVFRIALAATGIGLAILLITELVIHWKDLFGATTAAEKAQKAYTEAVTEGNNEVGKTVALAQELYEATQNTKLALRDRKLATEELLRINKENNEKTGQHIKLETDLHGVLVKNDGAIKNLTDSLFKQAYTKAYLSKIEEAYTALINSQNASLDSQTTLLGDFFANMIGGPEKVVEHQIKNYDKGVKGAKDYLEQLKKTFKKGLESGDLDLGGAFDGKGDKKQAEDYAKDLAAIRGEINKNEFDAVRQRRQNELTGLSDVVANEKKTLSQRLFASKEYYDKSMELAQLSKAFELKTLHDSIEEEKRLVRLKLKDPNSELTAKQKEELNKQLQLLTQKGKSAEKAIIEKYNADILKNNSDSEKQITDTLKSESDKRKTIDDETMRHKQSVHEDEMQGIMNDYNLSIAALDKKFAKGLIKERAYNLEKLKLQTQLQVELLKKDIEFTKDTIGLAEARAAASGKQEDKDAVTTAKKKLATLEVDLQKMISDFFVKSKEDEKKADEDVWKKRVANLEKYASYAKQVIGEINDLLSIGIEKEKNEIQAKEDAQQVNYENEVKRIQDSSIADEDKSNRLRILESERNAEKEANARRQRRLDVEKARYDKASAIASIILETIVAVLKTLPHGLVTGETYLVGALGAVALAKAIATPLPKYASGIKSSPETWALTDEKGPELYVHPDGSMSMGNDSPTLRFLRRGTQIIPHDEMMAMMGTGALGSFVNIGEKPDRTAKKIDDLKDTMIWQTRELLKASSNKKPLNIHVSGDFKNSDYIRKAVYE